MGCDIHTFVEIKKHINGENRWVSADHFRLNPYFDAKDDSEPEYEAVNIAADRDYNKFYQLAGVRGYEHDNKKISEPKGVPDDACQYYLSQCDKWEGDAHSHSYVTLKEVIDFRSAIKPTKVSGMIPEKTKALLDGDGVKPEFWCQATNQAGWTYAEWEDVFDSLKPVQDEMIDRAKEFYYRESEIDEWSENIRIVFFFDN